MLEAIRYVDLVIPEDNWAQKTTEITQHRIDIFTMGSDWTGSFDDLGALCEVRYLERTPEISSSLIKTALE